jgi:hypothetical protein
VDPFCPTCAIPIPSDDTNVAKDVALCRSCGKVFSFASLAKRSSPHELSEVDPSRPPAGIRLEHSTTRVAMFISTRSPLAFFLIPFTALWSGGSLSGIYGSQIRSGNFSLFQSLFGLPFLLGTLVLVPATLMCLCGHMRISLRGDEGQIFTGVSFFGHRVRFRASEISDVYVEASRPDSDGDRSWAIVLQREGTPIRLPASTRPAKRAFIVAVLRAWLGLQGHAKHPASRAA